jgi:hypothetical protein
MKKVSKLKKQQSGPVFPEALKSDVPVKGKYEGPG